MTWSYVRYKSYVSNNPWWAPHWRPATQAIQRKIEDRPFRFTA